MDMGEPGASSQESAVESQAMADYRLVSAILRSYYARAGILAEYVTIL
jgi:hypothetical protein